jgi:hypothetical protein
VFHASRVARSAVEQLKWLERDPARAQHRRIDPKEPFMHPFSLRDRLESLAGLVAAVVASVSILGAVALLFLDGGDSPWLASGSPRAKAAERCHELPSSSNRHECLREVVRRSAAASPAASAAKSPPAVAGAIDH